MPFLTSLFILSHRFSPMVWLRMAFRVCIYGRQNIASAYQDVHVIPETCEYVRLLGEEDLRLEMELELLTS